MSERHTNQPSISISSAIFDLFPDYRRGLVIVNQVTNGPSPEKLVNRIRNVEQKLKEDLSGKDINAIPRLDCWREAFRLSGIKPTKFRPSIDSLVRRVLSGNELPSINVLVDIGNLVSLMYLVPVGAHAIDVIQEGMELRLASGTEDFHPFGSDGLEHPEEGEIIFTDGNQVMTRRWVWRQAEHSLVRPSTTAVEFNIDLLPPLPVELQEDIFQSLADLVSEFGGGEIRIGMLERTQPDLPLFSPYIS